MRNRLILVGLCVLVLGAVITAPPARADGPCRGDGRYRGSSDRYYGDRYDDRDRYYGDRYSSRDRYYSDRYVGHDRYYDDRYIGRERYYGDRYSSSRCYDRGYDYRRSRPSVTIVIPLGRRR